MRKVISVVEPGRNHRERRFGDIEELRGARRTAAVMGNLQNIHGDRRHSGFHFRFDVTRQKDRAPLIRQTECEGIVIARFLSRFVPGDRRQHLHMRAPVVELPSRGERHDPGAGLPRLFAQELPQLALRCCSRPQFFRAEVCHQGREPSHMVLVAVGGDQHVYPPDRARPQVRRNHVFTGVDPCLRSLAEDRNAPSVYHHQLPIGQRDQQAFPLADIDGGQFQLARLHLGRKGMGNQKAEKRRSQCQRRPPKPVGGANGREQRNQRQREGNCKPRWRVRNPHCRLDLCVPVHHCPSKPQEHPGKPRNQGRTSEHGQEAERDYERHQRNDQQIRRKSRVGQAVEIGDHRQGEAKLDDGRQHQQLPGKENTAGSKANASYSPAHRNPRPQRNVSATNRSSIRNCATFGSTRISRSVSDSHRSPEE